MIFTTLSENYSWPTNSVVQLIKTNQLLKTFTTKTNENLELEAICKNLSEIKINIKR